MTYITPDTILFYITITTNVCFAALFVYHFSKEKSDKSLMILAGCLCLSMAFSHFLNSYKLSLDQSSLTYYNIVVNWYLIHLALNCLILLSVYSLHIVMKVRFHYVVRYVFRCVALSMMLAIAMHVDIMVLGNRDTDWLYTLFSFGENILAMFVFMSVLVARKWSEVFKWLQSAHSQ